MILLAGCILFNKVVGGRQQASRVRHWKSFQGEYQGKQSEKKEHVRNDLSNSHVHEWRLESRKRKVSLLKCTREKYLSFFIDVVVNSKLNPLSFSGWPFHSFISNRWRFFFIFYLFIYLFYLYIFLYHYKKILAKASDIYCGFTWPELELQLHKPQVATS